MNKSLQLLSKVTEHLNRPRNLIIALSILFSVGIILVMNINPEPIITAAN